MKWTADDWCTMGIDYDKNGIGEPVLTHKKPASRLRSAVRTPVDSDEFESKDLGLQWQWHANPQLHWGFTYPSAGIFRMYCRKVDGLYPNLGGNGNLLLQKVNAPNYTATAKLTFHPSYEGDRTGLVMMGHDYATIGLKYVDGKIVIEQSRCIDAMHKSNAEEVLASLPYQESGEPVVVYLRCQIKQEWKKGEQPRMFCRFAYSTDGKRFKELGEQFEAQAGHWIGAKIGFYADAQIHKNDGGWSDIDWFRVSEK